MEDTKDKCEQLRKRMWQELTHKEQVRAHFTDLNIAESALLNALSVKIYKIKIY